MQYREKVRATNLAYRNHAGFNPILGERVGAWATQPRASMACVFFLLCASGEQTFLMAMPEKPPVPDADTSKPDA